MNLCHIAAARGLRALGVQPSGCRIIARRIQTADRSTAPAGDKLKPGLQARSRHARTSLGVRPSGCLLLILLCITPAIAQTTSPAALNNTYIQDVRFALDEIPRRCGRLIELKKIDWPAVSREFLEEATKVKNDQDHLVMLVRLVARLKDGQAAVIPLEKGGRVSSPIVPQVTGPGMFWCVSGGRVYVKNSFLSAKEEGVKPGMEVLRVDGAPAKQWIEQRTRQRMDMSGFPTDHEALAATLHWGLAHPFGTELKLEFRDTNGGPFAAAVLCRRATCVPWGPLQYPSQFEAFNDIHYGKLPSGFGYIHLHGCRIDMPARVETALTEMGRIPGLILDFRANTGTGGFDHEHFMGQFVPEGKMLAFNRRFGSVGRSPFGGPIVAIVDALTRGGGEAAVCILKEDGRAYVIGESATAGMCASKRTIELPSRLFGLSVSVSSNMRRANGGKGIEGIGIAPHEIVQYDPKDLAAGVDTLLRRAEDLLRKFPQDKVPYNPADFGWKP